MSFRHKTGHFTATNEILKLITLKWIKNNREGFLTHALIRCFSSIYETPDTDSGSDGFVSFLYFYM